jgi:formamidopyrimidine-DNA glycosylase
MPELPEVETTMRGIAPYVCDQKIECFIVRNHQLRWPVAMETANMRGRLIKAVSRRGKYILMQLDQGTLIWHLGMSGSMKIRPVNSPVENHEHIEVQLASGQSLKFRDPRRFGALLYTASDPLQHRLLNKLGPEPLSDDFDVEIVTGWSVSVIFTPARPCFWPALIRLVLPAVSAKNASGS